MREIANILDRGLRAVQERLDLADGMTPRGVVRRASDGVCWVAGLADVGFEELLQFDSGATGMAYELGTDITGVLLLSGADLVREGDGVRGLRRLPEITVGEVTLGRLMDPLGMPLDDGPPLPIHPVRPLFMPAPPMLKRRTVDQSLWTGVLAIDAAVPIGRGQRELIVGDRNVGKTALALDIVAAQRTGDVACVYVVIGQPLSRVLSVRENLKQQKCFRNTAIVAADAAASPGMQYLAPYAGASIAESFRQSGRDALVVYDDLTKHADAYRELALLLGRPPGREAFPGDIFYIHAELLERATALRDDERGGSVTALPIVEISDGDLSSYIPTNLISITDGQLYLDAGRFENNFRPAIDIGRSVSRIGAAAQVPAIRAVAKNLRIEMARFESLEALTRVGLEMDSELSQSLGRGRLLRRMLKQARFAKRDCLEQVVTLAAVQNHWFDGLEEDAAVSAVQRLVHQFRERQPAMARQLQLGELPAAPWQKTLADLAHELSPAVIQGSES